MARQCRNQKNEVNKMLNTQFNCRQYPAAEPRVTLEPLEARLLLSAGELDPTFGLDGQVTSDWGSWAEYATTMTVQDDGKIIVAGTDYASGFVVARFNADGTLDDTFGQDGRVSVQVGGVDMAQALAVQDDGKIVLAGYTFAEWTWDFAVLRFNSDGSLDTSFDSDGVVVTDFGMSSDLARDVEIQSDGKIVVVGYTEASANRNIAMARYNTDGSLDATFDGDGLLVSDLGTVRDDAYAVAIQDDGKLVVAGQARQGLTDLDFAIIRYNADGTLDTTFGSGGKTFVDFDGSADQASCLAIQADGMIVVGGVAKLDGNNDFALVRLAADGTLDAGFGTDGRVTTAFAAGADEMVKDVIVGANGSILAVGYTNLGSVYYGFALASYNPDGTLDASFGTDGKVVTDIGSGNDFPVEAALQADGNVIVAGSAFQRETGYDFAMARYEWVQMDVTPPVIESVTVAGDLRGFVVELNDDDLDAAAATDLSNYRLYADGKEVAISSVTYDADADRIVLRTQRVVFGAVFELKIDGDNADGDGTSGLTDIAGNHIEGGDVTFAFDQTLVTAMNRLRTKLNGMNLHRGVWASMKGKLNAAQKLASKGKCSDKAILALTNSFARKVQHWSNKGKLDTDAGADLLSEAQTIMLGVKLTGK